MEPTKNQIVVILAVNLLLFLASILVVIKWAGVSNIRFFASLTGSLIFLFLIVMLLKTHYRMLIK